MAGGKRQSEGWMDPTRRANSLDFHESAAMNGVNEFTEHMR